MALRTDIVSKVGFIFCLCPEVLLVPAASLSHLRVLWHMCKWVRANNVPAWTKSHYLSSYWSLMHHDEEQSYQSGGTIKLPGRLSD